MVSVFEDVSEFRRTSSFPDSLDENSCYFPYLEFPIRRTNSSSDINRYYRYFDLLQRNNGVLFTWKLYLEILQEQLRSFDTLLILGKRMADHLSSDNTVPKSAYPFHQHWRNKDELMIVKNKPNDKILAKNDASITDTCSETSSYSTSFARKNRYVLLKKICSEIRNFTDKIHRIVERITVLTKKCPTCGNPLEDYKHLKYCTDIVEDVGDTAILLQQMCSKNVHKTTVLSQDDMPTYQDINVNAGGETKILHQSMPFDCTK